MSNAKTFSPFVIELHNRDINFQQYDHKNVDLYDKGLSNQNGSQVKNKNEVFPVLKTLNSSIKGIYELPKAKWDDDTMTMGSGLNNPGINICYMNVIIQVLTHTPYMESAMIKSYHTKVCLNYHNNIFCIMCLFEKYVKQSFLSPNSLNNPFYTIAKKYIWAKFKLGHQDDAFIFLKHFLDSLSKACYLNSEKKNESQGESSTPSSLPKDFISNDQIMSTFIGRLFGGYFRNVIICSNCSMRSEKVEEFFDLAVEVTKSNKMIDLLSKFVLPEKLCNDNKYFCSHCKGYQNANKSLSIYKLPRILNINLKRFNLYSSGYKKSLKSIEFPLMLSISLKAGRDHYVWLNYQLYAIVCHIGKSLHMGHYITFIKGKHGFWYCYDDSVIRTVSESKVLSHTNDVYLLFYSIEDESVENCDSALNKYSYTNIFNECQYSHTDANSESEKYEDQNEEQLKIISNFYENSILRKFLKHKKFKNYKLLNMRVFSNVYRLNYLKKKIKKIYRNNNHNQIKLNYKYQDDSVNQENENEEEEELEVKNESESEGENEKQEVSESQEESEGGEWEVKEKKQTENLNKNECKASKEEVKCSNRKEGEEVVFKDPKEVEVWSDVEDGETYKRLYEQMDQTPPKPREEDMEYDKGKVPKIKKNEKKEESKVELVNHNSGVTVAVNQKKLFDEAPKHPKTNKNKFKKNKGKKFKNTQTM